MPDNADPGEYAVIEYETRPTAIIRGRVKLVDLPSFFARCLPLVLEAIDEQGAIPGGEPFAYYRGVPDGSVDVEAGFPVVKPFAPSGNVVPGQLPGGHIVTGLHLGPNDTIRQTFASMTTWARTHGLRPTGDMWEIYLTDPERELDPSRWRTGVFLRVE